MTASTALSRPWRWLAALALLGLACRSGDGPRATLDRYFGSAVRGEYAAVYSLYDEAYRAKVPQDDFVRHRREAAPLASYEVLSLSAGETSARARVRLTFGSSGKLQRPAPVTSVVDEELVKERGGWRIKVW